MAVISTVTAVNYQPNGSVTVSWSDGTSTEFDSRASLQNYASDVETESVARKMLIRAWLYRSEDGGNPAWILSKTVQLDLALELNQLSFGVQ